MKTVKHLLIAAVIMPAYSYAQDIIVMRDGSIVQSKVTEITSSEVKYKKYSNLDGPLYTIDKNTILAINYENGEKETFEITEQQHAKAGTDSGQGVAVEIPVETDADNESIVKSYSTPVEFVAEKGIGKDAKWVLWKYGMTQNSVLSNKDIEISFELRWANFCCQYAIFIRNKTDETIYIDLDKTRWVDKEGKYYTYLNDKQQTSVTLGESSGGGIGLGHGIVLSGGSSNATTTTYFNNRYLDIPPHGKAILSDHNEAVTKEEKAFSLEETVQLSHCEDLFEPYGKKEGFIRENETLYFDEGETPYGRNYTIVYTKDEAYRTYSKIEFGIYIQQAFGWKNRGQWSSPNGTWSYRSAKREKLLEQYRIIKFKKDIPSYDTHMLLGAARLDKDSSSGYSNLYQQTVAKVK